MSEYEELPSEEEAFEALFGTPAVEPEPEPEEPEPESGLSASERLRQKVEGATGATSTPPPRAPRPPSAAEPGVPASRGYAQRLREMSHGVARRQDEAAATAEAAEAAKMQPRDWFNVSRLVGELAELDRTIRGQTVLGDPRLPGVEVRDITNRRDALVEELKPYFIKAGFTADEVGSASEYHVTPLGPALEPSRGARDPYPRMVMELRWLGEVGGWDGQQEILKMADVLSYRLEPGTGRELRGAPFGPGNYQRWAGERANLGKLRRIRADFMDFVDRIESGGPDAPPREQIERYQEVFPERPQYVQDAERIGGLADELTSLGLTSQANRLTALTRSGASLSANFPRIQAAMEEERSRVERARAEEAERQLLQAPGDLHSQLQNVSRRFVPTERQLAAPERIRRERAAGDAEYLAAQEEAARRRSDAEARRLPVRTEMEGEPLWEDIRAGWEGGSLYSVPEEGVPRPGRAERREMLKSLSAGPPLSEDPGEVPEWWTETPETPEAPEYGIPGRGIPYQFPTE